MTQPQEKNKVSFSFPRKSDKAAKAFLLGFVVALSVVTTTTVSGVLWFCSDVPATPTLECPRIISKKGKKSGTFMFMKNKKADALELELMAPDPKHCACRIFKGLFTRSLESETPIICRPQEKQESVAVSKQVNPELKAKYKVAFTQEKLQIPSEHLKLIKTLDERVRDLIPDWDERTRKVQWGGDVFNWYDPKRRLSDPSDLERLDGGALFYSYLRIMKWPQSLHVKFPFKLCAKGCNSEEALRHSLEFREKFKPWMASPTVIKDNAKGYVFTKGFSSSRVDTENGAHAIVWIRPGLRTKTDDVAQTRVYLNALERGVAASLKRSNGRVGKFNVVLDGSGYNIGLLPPFHQVKVLVTILQDHFTDRVGIILMSNLGGLGEILVKMFLKVITEEVRNKIILLPQDPKERQEILNTVVGYENSPTWLGGTDTYQFNSDEYYSDKRFIFTDQEATAYLESMPYHS